MLKNLKKYSKYVGMILALFIIGVPVLTGLLKLPQLFIDRNEYVLEIDKQKVDKKTIDELSGDVAKSMYVIHLIDRNIVDKHKKTFHINVSNDEINGAFKSKMDQIRKQHKIDNMTDNEIVRVGFRTTVPKFKKDISHEILLGKIKDIVGNTYVPTENEIEEYYKQEHMITTELEDVKDDIIEKLKNNNKSQYFANWMEQEREKVSIKVLNEDYKSYIPFKLVTLNKLYMYNYEIYNLMQLYLSYPMLLNMGTKGTTNEEKAAHLVYDAISREILLANRALSDGIVAPAHLAQKDKIRYLKEKLESNIKSGMKIEEWSIKKYYSSNKDKYIEKERAYADIVFFSFKIASSDISNFEKESQKTLDQAIESNTLPKGEFQTLTLEEFTKKYGKKKFKANEVFQSLIKNGKNLIIAKEKDNKILFVELKPKISQETMDKIRKQANDLYDQVTAQQIDMKKAMELHSDVNFKKEQTIYRDGKFEKALENLVMSKDGCQILETEKGIYIVKRKSYFPYKLPEFSSIKERVSNDYKNVEFNRIISNLISKLEKENKVRVKKSYFKSLISPKSDKKDKEKEKKK